MLQGTAARRVVVQANRPEATFSQADETETIHLAAIVEGELGQHQDVPWHVVWRQKLL